MSTDNSGRSSTRPAKMLDRRTFLATSAITALAGCLGGDGQGNGDTPPSSTSKVTGTTTPSKPFEGKTLRVATWGGIGAESHKKVMKPKWEEETGATLKIIGDWSGFIAKIKSAPADDPPFDLTVADGNLLFQGVSNDLFLPIRYDNITRWDQVWDGFKNEPSRSNEYGVPTEAGLMAMPYRKDAIDWEPNAWADLLEHTDVRFGMDGGFFVYPLQIAAIASDAKPDDDELYDDGAHDAAFQTLKDFDVEQWATTGSDMWKWMRQGLVDVGQWYFASSFNHSQEEGSRIGMVVPEVTSGYLDHYSVVRGTDNRELAEHWIDYRLREDICSEIAKSLPVVYANKNTTYPEAMQQYIPTTNEGVKSLQFPDFDYLGDYFDQFSERFKKLKTES